MGIAIHKSFGSIVGAVIDISSNRSGRLELHSVWISVDCGKVVNPDIVRAQMEGGFIFGLSAAVGEEITLKAGRVEQSNFHDYSVLRMKSTPDISVSIIESGEDIGGIGEASVPLAAPALANAIFSATGKRFRSLPFKKHGVIYGPKIKPLFYKKDIGILARSGFDFDTSKRVMDLEKSEYLKIINLL